MDMKKIDLSGEWNYKVDECCHGMKEKFYERRLKNRGFHLPGSTCEHGIGKKAEGYQEMNRETVRAPREKYEYIGMIWLQREIIIPKEFKGKRITLFLERVNIASRVWIDGKPVGRQIIGLSTPHCYDLTEALKNDNKKMPVRCPVDLSSDDVRKITEQNMHSESRHILTICVDNRDLLHMDGMASGYSIDTQGIWNGIIGKMELRCEETCCIDQVQVDASCNKLRLKVVSSEPLAVMTQKKTKLKICVYEEEGLLHNAQNRQNHPQKEAPFKKLAEAEQEFCRHARKQTDYFTFDLPVELKEWDEFRQNQYYLEVVLFADSNGFQEADKKEYSFGVRKIEVKEKQFYLNGKPIALRGTTDCAIFPLTGYPVMEKEFWQQRFSIIKEFGLNHVRFHAWCPPEAAFVAADEAGLYLQIEMPLWLNDDVTSHCVGDDPGHRSFYFEEAKKIVDTYGNHPSFFFFSNGNELGGDFSLLEEITSYLSHYDTRHLYTMTSNFDHPAAECEDYFCAFNAYGKPIRIEHLHDEVAKDTCLDFKEAIEKVPVPVVSFEVGQYCVYPELDKIENYTGNMKPVNLEVIRKDMKKKGTFSRLSEYIAASGDMAVKFYKEDIEAVLRTKGMGGIQLLSLSDYTGQCTATIGMLDAFYQKKDFITTEHFRQFCNEVVVLWKSKRIFTDQEMLEAELDLYDYGEKRIENPVFEIQIFSNDVLVYEMQTTKKKIVIPFDFIKAPAMLRVEVRVKEYKNQWNLFVYSNKLERLSDSTETESQVQKSEDSGPMLRDCESKNRRLDKKVFITAEKVKNPIPGSFLPVFWSPAYFPSKQSCGAIVRNEHAIFEKFPTGRYIDYQWKNLLEHASCVDISSFGEDFVPVIEPVPNFFDNVRRSPLWEVKVGDKEVLFCGFDFSQKDLPTMQLKESVLEYFQSDRFAPKYEVPEDVFAELFVSQGSHLEI